MTAPFCDLGARPAGAPHFAGVAGAVRAVRREAGALVVDYDPAMATTLAAIVEAERRCCADVGWSLEAVGPDAGVAGGAGGAGAADAAGAEGEADAAGGVDGGGGVGGTLRLRVAGTPTQLDALVLLFAPATPEGAAPAEAAAGDSEQSPGGVG